MMFAMFGTLLAGFKDQIEWVVHSHLDNIVYEYKAQKFLEGLESNI